MKKKGFTLIELLAVIVVLAIIALIATPIILGVIEKTKYGAFRNSIGGVVNAIENSYAINMVGNKKCEDSYAFHNGEVTSDLKVKGDLPEKGVSFVDGEDVFLYSETNGMCAKTDILGKIQYGKTKDGKCDVVDEHNYKHNDDAIGLKGEGTEENPYQISSIEDLVFIAKECHKFESICPYTNTHMILTTSLDFKNDESYLNPNSTELGDLNEDNIIESIKNELTTNTGWWPIHMEKIEALYFDGNNNAIKNLYINRPSPYIGLFGTLKFNSNLVMKNIDIIGVDIRQGTYGTAGLIGWASSNVNSKAEMTNIRFSGNIDGQWYTGGLIGHANFPLYLNKIYSEGIINGSMDTGGIVGGNTGSTSASELINIANIDTEAYSSGVIGRTRFVNPNTNRLANFGTIIATGHYVGGIFGYADSEDATITELYNYGDMTAPIGPSRIEGIIGNTSVTISNSMNYGNIIVS